MYNYYIRVNMVGFDKANNPMSGVSDLDGDLDSSIMDSLMEHSTMKFAKVYSFIVDLG